ncbi:hypothetical protein [Armatimonas sp.]|uniref:hypothetical protein n=1 Tax=Armatimonas sp. TaxID=1872638 RepID=UPI003751FAD8
MIPLLWQELSVSAAPVPPETEALLAALRRIYTNGGAELRIFDLSMSALWLAHAAYDDLDRLGFPDLFLRQPAVDAVLPAPQRVVPPGTESGFSRLGEPLEDHLTLRLISGGAYVACDLSAEEAEDIVIAFCHALFSDSSGNLTTYLSELGWHGWLHDIAWDATLVTVDRTQGRVWVLMLTDMD